MKTLFRLACFAFIYGLHSPSARAADASAPLPVVGIESVPEPAGIGLISFLVVLLALLRQRDLQA